MTDTQPALSTFRARMVALYNGANSHDGGYAISTSALRGLITDFDAARLKDAKLPTAQHSGGE